MQAQRSSGAERAWTGPPLHSPLWTAGGRRCLAEPVPTAVRRPRGAPARAPPPPKARAAARPPWPPGRRWGARLRSCNCRSQRSRTTGMPGAARRMAQPGSHWNKEGRSLKQLSLAAIYDRSFRCSRHGDHQRMRCERSMVGAHDMRPQLPAELQDPYSGRGSPSPFCFAHTRIALALKSETLGCPVSRHGSASETCSSPGAVSEFVNTVSVQLSGYVHHRSQS